MQGEGGRQCLTHHARYCDMRCQHCTPGDEHTGHVEDGSKSVKYYDAKMRNVLTLCNYHFLPTQAKPKQKKLWSHPMLCAKGSWVMWGHVAHRAAYDASATSEGRQDDDSSSPRRILKRKQEISKTEREHDAPAEPAMVAVTRST